MNFFHYLWALKNSRWQILLTFAIAVGFGAAFSCSKIHAMSFFDMWQNWMEAFLSFAIIILGVFIWYNEKKQDWEITLAKKLDVYFYYQDRVFYEVKNAPLAGDNDIRQWGQQLGMQMNEGEKLHFREFNVRGPVRDTTKSGEHIMRYVLTIWLQSIGDGKTEKIWQYDDDGKL